MQSIVLAWKGALGRVWTDLLILRFLGGKGAGNNEGLLCGRRVPIKQRLTKGRGFGVVALALTLLSLSFTICKMGLEKWMGWGECRAGHRLAQCQGILHVTAPGEAPSPCRLCFDSGASSWTWASLHESCFALVTSHIFAPRRQALCLELRMCSVNKALRIRGLWPDAPWLLRGTPGL